MKVAGILTFFLLFLFPLWGKEEKVYIAKYKKSIDYRKKKRFVKSPVRVNTSVSGERLKLEEMLKDINEQRQF